MLRAVTLIALLLVPPHPVVGQSVGAPDPQLTALTGHWEGIGTILGQPSRVSLEWAPVLDGRFHRLTFESHIGPEPRTRHFQGHAYYRATPQGYHATWFDSSGLVRPIESTRQADAIVSVWGTAETEVGETTYRLVTADTLEVVDRVGAKDGTWREFGRVTLTRAR